MKYCTARLTYLSGMLLPFAVQSNCCMAHVSFEKGLDGADVLFPFFARR